MVRLWKNIALIVLPIIVFVLFIPLNRREQYVGLLNDCDAQGIWIHDRIYSNPSPADVVFLGSSHTINGINDEVISEMLLKVGKTAVNLGYCRLGRDLQFTLLKEVMAEKHPKYVILEVRKDEDRYSHPTFPFLGSLKDVVFTWPWFNRDMFSNMFNMFKYRLELLQDVVFQSQDSISENIADFGYRASETAISEQEAKILIKDRAKRKRPLSDFGRWFYMQFPREYLKKIKAECVENNVELMFLYLPSFAMNHHGMAELETYRKLGEVITPPDSILEDRTMWHDKGHLNKAGAQAISKWFGNQLIVKIEGE